jgi:hypothetical protein
MVVAVAAVDELNLKIQHGGGLNSVSVISSTLPFAESLNLVSFRRSKVSGEASGVGLPRSQFTKKFVGPSQR